MRKNLFHSLNLYMITAVSLMLLLLTLLLTSSVHSGSGTKLPSYDWHTFYGWAGTGSVDGSDYGSDVAIDNAGNVYILCKRIDGVWIVDAEDCS